MRFLGITCAAMGHIFIVSRDKGETLKTLRVFKATMGSGSSVMVFRKGFVATERPCCLLKKVHFNG